MESNLTNSIYLNDQPTSAPKQEQTEEIMREDSSAHINESAKKRPIQHHFFEKTMMATNFQTNQQMQKESVQLQAEDNRKHKTARPCHHSIKSLLNQYRIPPKPQADPKVIQKREALCKQHQRRQAGKAEVMKSNLLRRVHLDACEEAESSIQEELCSSIEAKEERVLNFIQRQQFFAQEREILRGMREFIHYGSIRLS